MIPQMNTRIKLSAVLLCLGLILALLPSASMRSLTISPEKLNSRITARNSWFTVDQVARFLVSEDSTVHLIDLRPENEYRKMNIPGSISIPYSEFLKTNPVAFLSAGKIKNILYSSGDIEAGYAFLMARRMNFKNTFVMKGGLEEWLKTIMNSRFTGERISPKENALFETRTRAAKLFTEINSLPDSLKMKYMQAKHSAANKLDGGCE
jgi:rhodanese-related sulfurtransferase